MSGEQAAGTGASAVEGAQGTVGGGAGRAAGGKRKRREEGGQDEGAEAEGQRVRTRWWQTEAGPVRARNAGQDGANWVAGRRRTTRKLVVRLRDVRMARMAGGEDGARGSSATGESVRGALRSSNRGRSDSSECSGKDSKFAKFGSNFGDTGSEVIRSGTIEEITVMANAGRGGRYAVGSRWHEPMMIAMLRQFVSPSLGWRFGDG